MIDKFAKGRGADILGPDKSQPVQPLLIAQQPLSAWRPDITCRLTRVQS
jgi:hypothetical protein